MIAGFLLDENLPRWWRRALLRLQPTVRVWHVGDRIAPPLHAPDPEILVWCEEHHAVLLTNNRQTMSEHLAHHIAAGRHVPGILLINPAIPIKQLASTLALVVGASFEYEYRDIIRFFPVV